MKSNQILLFIHIVIAVLLLCTLGNAWVPPNIFGNLNLLSLGFPYLMFAYLILTVVWIFKKQKVAVAFALGIFLFYNPIRRWVNYSPKVENVKTIRDIKVLTFNVKYGDYGWDKIKDYIKEQNADIILVQEKDTNRALRQDLVKYPSVILKTKHKIVRQAEIIEEKARGNSFYADIDINGKIVRIVNVYLEPFRLHKSMFTKLDAFGAGNISALLSHMIPTFQAHEDQVKKIRKIIDLSPYPVILAGDFNSVPNSYEYYNLGKDLQDAFLVAGKGSASSFHDYKVPLRIDYIFTSKSIIPLSYKVDHSVKLSDHYPVIAEFLLN
ncbi:MULTISPECIES: endonuclease/exonuclease/phosphatase family protein [Chryseobacterium]|uniref:Metal-dependent hydrolase n=1 Tax=Chryseobacterium rhizosphaerae TaxID=395937 RepID=A0ABX9IQ63_9FLAO|nr:MULTISPECIES: endonuclease/exonuclease/phosphatase family protein [Chryseobacterium]MDC8102530.1 endonuclease/exonuclease/phosphatase family protein [Chryseobacterium rhizosphaerae]MDR6546130.1 endonuclease/exonuclease/phosphatase family metal-dependent hydrolase [Chryseobacterium rhizosphaerae]REC77815.1 metal-dependent hydrolase [Chryseobacterium rhizosphaerae]SMC91274.1 Metal-dependent hydrolase, endonuclease/exonuclease/phosphatase family [Chryseobacterium sp. YR221]GEN67102.1 endonucle